MVEASAAAISNAFPATKKPVDKSAAFNLSSIKSSDGFESADSVPAIDLRSHSIITPEQRKEIVQAIASASSEWGFFQVVNHGIDTSLLEKAMQVSHAFFKLPKETKLKWEQVKRYSFNEDGYGSRQSPKGAGDDEYVRDYLFLCSSPNPNLEKWPSEPPEYRETMSRLSDEFLVLAKKLLGFLSEGVGLPTSYLEEALAEPTQSIMTNYYPPFPEPEKVHGIAPHSDFGGLTLLVQDIPGLLVLKGNAWYMVDPIPGAITIDISDLVELLSNGRYRSVIHRVRVHESKTRMSIASNYSCSFETTVAPAPELIDEEHPQAYKPVKFGDYVAVVAKSGPAGKSYMLMNT